jgi:hypothetical protein
MSESEQAGGRAAALLELRGRWFLVCDNAVFAVEKDGFREVFSYFSGGSALDGEPYHGDSVRHHAALALDGVTVVIGPRRIPLAQILHGILRVARLVVSLNWGVAPGLFR